MSCTAPTKTETFTEWFSRQGIRNFSADEFTSYFSVFRRGVRNSTPPRAMWPAILPTLRIVDDLRDHFSRAIIITSSYRSPAYNGAINSRGSGGAASKSFHMQFIALDIVAAGHSPDAVFEHLSEWRRAKKFTGGLGSYSSFTHIDTRGYNATWG